MSQGQRFNTKLLVVSPDLEFVQRIRDMLKGKVFHVEGRNQYHMSYAVYWEQETPQAMTAFERLHPDLVVIQGNLLGGAELARQIRQTEERRHTGIVFFEAESGLDSLAAFDLGADDFINLDKSCEEIIARMSATIRLKIMTDELRQVNHRLEILSNTDDLTGLYNMRYFEKFYGDLSRQSLANKVSYAVVMLDLDRFKSINDTTNHLVGSYIIGEIGKLIRLSAIFGPSACPARYGGDEFIVAFLCDSEEEVSEKCEAIRGLIEEAQFEKDGFEISITSSVGACFVERGFNGDCNDPVKCADLMLYKSKEGGRNMVSVARLAQAQDFSEICSAYHAGRQSSKGQVNSPRFNYIKIVK